MFHLFLHYLAGLLFVVACGLNKRPGCLCRKPHGNLISMAQSSKHGLMMSLESGMATQGPQAGLIS